MSASSRACATRSGGYRTWPSGGPLCVLDAGFGESSVRGLDPEEHITGRIRDPRGPSGCGDAEGAPLERQPAPDLERVGIDVDELPPSADPADDPYRAPGHRDLASGRQPEVGSARYLT